MAFFILLIALVVIASNILNYIQEKPCSSGKDQSASLPCLCPENIPFRKEAQCDHFHYHGGAVFEGRFPQYDNEIALAAKYAGEKGLRIGDEVSITVEGKEAAYIISGFTQTSNNLGKDCLLTRQGYERLGELQNASYYLNLGEETDIETFHKEVKGRTDLVRFWNRMSAVPEK